MGKVSASVLGHTWVLCCTLVTTMGLIASSRSSFMMGVTVHGCAAELGASDRYEEGPFDAVDADDAPESAES